MGDPLSGSPGVRPRGPCPEQQRVDTAGARDLGHGAGGPADWGPGAGWGGYASGEGEASCRGRVSAQGRPDLTKSKRKLETEAQNSPSRDGSLIGHH